MTVALLDGTYTLYFYKIAPDRLGYRTDLQLLEKSQVYHILSAHCLIQTVEWIKG